MEQYLQGIGVSPGIALAPALVFFHDRYEVPAYPVTDLEAELARLDVAMTATRKDLELIYERTVSGLGKSHADIFHAHLMILEDVALREDIQSYLAERRHNVEHILDLLAKRYVQVMESLDDPRFRGRTADLLDVVDRLLRHLLDSERPDLKHLADPRIIVAHDLSPSDTASMDTNNAVGLLVEGGSVTSHSAILARALEIPAVVGATGAAASVQSGVMVILDGLSGRVIINPAPDTVARYSEARDRLARRQARLLRIAKAGPARTSDDIEITLSANIELPLELPHSLKVNAQGIGLYRTEYLFLDRDTEPSEEEQYAAYSHVVDAMAPLPVTLRTMDIGGDKFAAHLQIFKEENPQLGWRAVRFCLARPDLFKKQLRAMLRAAVHGEVRIMFPMISGIEELRRVKKILAEAHNDLEAEGVAHNPDVRIGSMIEVPSAVVLVDKLAAECDFFSIGTNDLIQYLLAVDRVNEKIAHLYQPAHPSVVRMLHMIATAARAHRIPCSICGEMAGDPLYTELLLGLGISSLSMAPVAIPSIRSEITHINMKKARELVRQVLALCTTKEIKSLITERHRKRAAQYDYIEGPDNGFSTYNQERDY